MTALPESLDTATADGAGLPIAGAAPTDFGLSEAAQSFQSMDFLRMRVIAAQAHEQKIKDLQAVQPQLEQLRASNYDAAATDAANWNGQPGFAQDQIANARERLARVAGMDGLTPGQRAELTTAGNNEIAQFGNHVIEHESGVIAQQGVDRNEVASNAAMTGLVTDFGATKQRLLDNYDGSQAGLTTATLSAFDQAAATARQNVPPLMLPAFDAKVSAMRVQEAAGTSTIEAKGADAFVLKNGTQQAQTAINGIESNPSSYDNVTQQVIPSIVAAMPQGLAGLKKDVEHDLMGQAAQARVRGLINNGEIPQAQAELADGRYDAFLTPPQKEELVAKADAAARDKAPRSLDQALDRERIERAAQADIAARLTTGKGTGLSAGDLASLPYEQQAKIIMGQTDASRQFAVTGGIRQMDMTHLRAAAAAGPPQDTAAPDYQAKLQTWQISQKAAITELQSREKDPAAWVMDLQGKAPPAKGQAGISVTTDRAGFANQNWAAAAAGDAMAGARYAGVQLGAQYGVGIPAGQRRIVPEATAAQVAASVNGAEPQGRMKALQDTAALAAALPLDTRLPDGTHANPRAMFLSELVKAHLDTRDASAIADFGQSPAALGAYVAARNDPTASKPLPGGQEKILEAQVKANLQPEIRATMPLPGAESLTQARIDRTVMMARSLVNGGMAPESAAAQAASTLTSGYRYVDTWRMPDALSHGVGVGPNGTVTDGAGEVRNGAAALVTALTAHGGKNLYIPPSGGPAYPNAVAHSGRWVPTPGDGGLTLMTPKTDGSWQPVADVFKRPVTATWADLKAYGRGDRQPTFTAPPEQHAPAPPAAAGQPPAPPQPVPGFSRQSAMRALGQAVESKETRPGGPLVSSAGALGVRQVLPDTAKPYAQSLYGQPLDAYRLEHDNDYNRKISDAILADHVNHFGATPGGLALAIASYFDGRGNVEGYTDAKGYHPGVIQKVGDPRQGMTLDDWIPRLPPKTQDYVRAVLPRTLAFMQAG